jgi:hypothetical protein
MIKYFYICALFILLSSCSGLLYIDEPQHGTTYTLYPHYYPKHLHTVTYAPSYYPYNYYYHYKQPYIKKHHCYSNKSYNYNSNNKKGNTFYGHRKDY